MSLTDTEILDLVAKAKRYRKAAETRAYREYNLEKKRIWEFWVGGTDDVGRAAQRNAMRRAEIVLANKLDAARDRYQQRLDEARANAGKWAELVPST
jgi:hypothetical protein